jgi:hypothetical protein
MYSSSSSETVKKIEYIRFSDLPRVNMVTDTRFKCYAGCSGGDGCYPRLTGNHGLFSEYWWKEDIHGRRMKTVIAKLIHAKKRMEENGAITPDDWLYVDHSYGLDRNRKWLPELYHLGVFAKVTQTFIDACKSHHPDCRIYGDNGAWHGAPESERFPGISDSEDYDSSHESDSE